MVLRRSFLSITILHEEFELKEKQWKPLNVITLRQRETDIITINGYSIVNETFEILLQ